MVHIDKIVQNIFIKIKKRLKHNRDEYIIRHSKEAYCIIRRRGIHYEEGLFASYLAIIKMIYEVKTRGLIPVVDMQTEKNPYLVDDEVGKKNAWDYFFRQPGNVKLEQVVGKKNVIYLYEPPFNSFPSDSMDFLTDSSEVQFWRTFVHENISFSEEVEQYLHKYDETLNRIKSIRTLGVYLRGTDYAGIQPEGHAVVPDVQESIDKVKKIMEEYQCTQIFLSVEDESIQREYERKFGECLLSIDQLRYINTEKTTIMLREEFIESDVRETGLKYLAAVYLMSKCDCLVAARCCGSIGALLLSDGYEYMYFWNKGRYKRNHLNQQIKEK